MNLWEFRDCSCGRPMVGVVEGVQQFPGMAVCGELCRYCDVGVLLGPSAQMWLELEQLEAGSFRRRTSMAEHEAGMHLGINCRCSFPQAEPPSELA